MDGKELVKHAQVLTKRNKCDFICDFIWRERWYILYVQIATLNQFKVAIITNMLIWILNTDEKIA